MCVPRFARLLGVGLVTWLALVHVTPAAGAGPTRDVMPTDYVTTVDLCGFPVQLHLQGASIGLIWRDASGNILRGIVVFPHLTQTLTNLTTGTTLHFSVTGPLMFDETGGGGHRPIDVVGQPGHRRAGSVPD